jgi:ribose 1,5-bisphosphokinase
MSGRLIAVVGPSGVGKDSVMAGMARRDLRLVLARRVITRPADAGGEAFEAVSEETFLTRRAAGDFALSWGAHGLHYGIPIGIEDDLRCGRDVLVNLSRNVLVRAKELFPRLDVLHLTAAPEILAARLAARGREDTADIAERLDRAAALLPEGISALRIDNSGALEQTVQAALDHFYPVRA